MEKCGIIFIGIYNLKRGDFMPYKNNRNENKKSEFERVNNKENKGVYKVLRKA